MIQGEVNAAYEAVVTLSLIAGHLYQRLGELLAMEAS